MSLLIIEEERLGELESVIERGLKTFVDVGMALLEIRDSRLYREDYSTFEDYCRDRWGFTRMRASQLIASYEVVNNVNNCLQIPQTESQARPLTSLEPEQQREAWARAVETAPDGKITAAHVQEVVSRMREKEILSQAKRIQAEKREEKRAERIEIITNEKPLDNIGPFNVIYADPPWKYDYSQSTSREIENQYPTMELEDICKLQIANICSDDCVLFMWSTSPKLYDAMKVIDAWGFTYKTCMVWVKDKIGMGYYARQQHELLLIATIGNLPVPKPEDRPSSVIYGDRNEHSEKPDEVYILLENMYPEFSKVELFGRKLREGWFTWGNQV